MTLLFMIYRLAPLLMTMNDP